MITTLTPAPRDATEPTSQAASGRELDWYDPSLADRDMRSVAKAVIIAVALLFGALVDAGLMRPAIMRVLRDSPTMAGIIAVALAVIGATAAATAGAGWRGAKGAHPGGRAALILPSVILLFWAGLGLGIGWLRIGAVSITTIAQYDGQQAGTATGGSTSSIAAGVFLLVYGLVGVLAFADAYEWRNDAFSAKIHAQKKLASSQQQLADSEALLVRLVENFNIRKHELAVNPQHAANAKRANQALAAELEQVSRDEQMIGLQDPSKSGITSGQHPDNPYPAHA